MLRFFQEIRSQSIRYRGYLILLTISIACSYGIYLFLDEKTIAVLGMENQLFELATFAFFSVSGFLCLRMGLRSKSFVLFMLGLVLLFGAGEEISWGQQFFKFSTPDSIKTKNIQGETNIHNLKWFHTGDEDHVKKQGWERLLEINFLFRLFCLAYFVVLPFLILISPVISRFTAWLRLPVPPLVLGVFFLINWFSFRTTLNALPTGRPLEPNSIFVTVQGADSNIRHQTIRPFEQLADSLLQDPQTGRLTAAVSSYELVDRGRTSTSLDIHFQSPDERGSFQTKQVFEQLAKRQRLENNESVRIEKDEFYYCTTTEAFECLSALLFLLSFIIFIREKKPIATPSDQN